MKLVDLKGKQDADAVTPQQPSSQYPYGLNLTLNDDVLEALGIDTLPATGVTVSIEARAVVETVHDPVGDMLDGRRLCLQIVALGMDVPKAPKTPGARVYGDAE